VSGSTFERSAAEIARAVTSGALSATAVTEAALARVDAVDDTVGAYLTRLHDVARGQAAAVDARVRAGERLPLAGVPLAVKDNMCLTATRTTAASKILEHWVAPYTATAVARLLDAGCVPIGKANLDEFAMGSSCENSALGVTRNRAVRAAVLLPPSRRLKRPSRWAAIRVVPFASPRRFVIWSALNRPTAGSLATASSRLRRASTKSGR
jgi:Asp-tRNA(Asn)/Glu-tRNA(Gln) amidotransferase A subunit family amidase